MKTVIKFGTDGWRSVIADGFTFDNVKRVTQAACDVVRTSSRSRLILIGYDRRFFSLRFAETAAQVATANGFKVEVSSSPIGSPVLSAAMRQRKAAMGFMITASHNPYTFNGFKLKGPHGGSVDESVTLKVEQLIDENPIKIESAPLKKIDFIASYLSGLKKWVSPTVVSKLNRPVIFDGMNGPGADMFEQLTGGKNVVFVRKETDPMFGGQAPEPIETYLGPLKAAILKHKGSIGIAVDGDTDRVGVIDEKGRYLPPHTVMPLILLHLIENRKLKGKVVQTVSMGYLPGRIAQHFKLPFEETPVGFKYIAQRMEKEKVLLGGEESGGYGVGLWSPERDGLLCGLLLIEMLSKSKKPLSELVDDLQKRFGVSCFKRVDFQVEESMDKKVWTDAIVATLGPTLANHPVANVNQADGLKITLADGSWVLMRPSGTEPLIRTYSEGTSDQIVSTLLTEADRLVRLPFEALKRERAEKPTRKKKKNTKR